MAMTDVSGSGIDSAGTSEVPDTPWWGRPDHFKLAGGQSVNVADGERIVLAAVGSIAALFGLGRRDIPGLLIAAVGGALVYRGATGHSHAYDALGIDTADEAAKERASHGIHVVHSCLIGKSPEELYRRWRKFENLPDIMSHLESVEIIDEFRSHWIGTAPSIAGGRVEWDAEVVDDTPNERIAWQSLPGADVDNRGAVRFVQMPGDRGTAIRVEIEYRPPAGRLGQLVAKLFGEAPEQQIREDLRRFKRVMEVGEVPSVEGQPHGSCGGLARLRCD